MTTLRLQEETALSGAGHCCPVSTKSCGGREESHSTENTAHLDSVPHGLWTSVSASPKQDLDCLPTPGGGLALCPGSCREGLEEEQGSQVCGCPGRTFCWAGGVGMVVTSKVVSPPGRGMPGILQALGEQKGPSLEFHPCHPLTLRHWAYDLTTLNLSLLSL